MYKFWSKNKRQDMTFHYVIPLTSQDNFELFINIFDLNLDSVMVHKYLSTVALVGFNAKSSLCYNNDTATYKGSKTNGWTLQFGLQQIIKEPTQIIGDSLSCLYLIFTTQPNLIMESWPYSSLHSNCHHHLTFESMWWCKRLRN